MTQANNSADKKKRSLSLLSLVSPVQFILGVVLAFVAGALFLLVFQEDPVEAYGALWKGAFGSKRFVGETLLSMTPLIFGGLAVALGFRCGLFNMGVEGQIVLGGMLAAYIGYAWELPRAIHLPLAIVGGGLAGGFWGGIPGYLKARFKIHEVITTIMFNYVVFEVASYMIAVGGPMKADSGLPVSPDILPTAKLNRIWEGTRLSSGIFLALVVAAVVWVFLFKTRLGYKVRAVGFNRDAAEYAGIQPGTMMVLAMVLSGALGGMAGAIEVLGVHYKFYATFSPGYGWDAIAVALLGLVHPVGVVASAFLFGVLRSGSVTMQAIAQISKDIVQVLTALIIFFSAMNKTLQPALERIATRLSPGGSQSKGG
jgi:simple sugar transport system permease protein